MTRSDIRTMLRRWLNETVADQWANADLDKYINLGLGQVQKYVLAVNPEAVVYVDTTNIIANQELYEWPAGMIYEIEVAVLDSATSEYEPIEHHPWHLTRSRADGSTLQYSHHGMYFGISPIPTANLANGIRLRWVPSLTMANDSDVPPVLTALHPAIAMWAKKLALGETGEGLDELRKEISDIVSDLGRFYVQSASEPAPALRVNVSKGY